MTTGGRFASMPHPAGKEWLHDHKQEDNNTGFRTFHSKILSSMTVGGTCSAAATRPITSTSASCGSI